MPVITGNIKRKAAGIDHDPATFINHGGKSRSMFGSEFAFERSKSCVEDRTEFQMRRPFIIGRSVTTSEELPARSKSNDQIRTKYARQRSGDQVNKQRRDVNIARFYDWSEDLDSSISASRLYRELASISRSLPDTRSKFQTISTTTKETDIPPSPGTSSQLYDMNNGRMFVRDKKTLTRGEREIIEGIFKNRGDVIARDAIGGSKFQVKSHKDAWYVGKSPYRNLGLGKIILKGVKIDEKPLKPCCHLHMDKLSISSNSGEWRCEDTSYNRAPSSMDFKVQNSSAILPFLTCVICQANQDAQSLAKRTMMDEVQGHYRDESPSAPPSTPDHTNVCKWMQQQHLFGKLLHTKTTLPLDSPENMTVHNTNHEQIIAGNQQGHGLSHIATTKSYFRGVPVLLNWALDDFAVLSVQSSRTTSGRISNSQKICARQNCNERGCAGHTMCDAMKRSHHEAICNSWIVTNKHDGEGSDDSDLDKRLKLKVYIPTAETDHTDEDIGSVVACTERSVT